MPLYRKFHRDLDSPPSWYLWIIVILIAIVVLTTR
jgi:hypothetical protein